MSARSTFWRLCCGLAILLVCRAAVADQDKVLQFKSATKIKIKGQDHLVVLANLPHGRATRLVIANSDPAGAYSPITDQAQLIQSLKVGDLIQASWDIAGTVNTTTAIAPYAPKPGELAPNGYIFLKSEPKEKSQDLILTLKKLGETISASVTAEKDTQGAEHRDPLIDATLAGLHEGDSVWVDLSTGTTPTVVAILPYTEPVSGKLVKIDTTELDGQKVPTVEIDTGGVGVAAVIPGKPVSGKWVPNARLSAAAHRCKPGTVVLYRVQQDGSATWLRDIEAQTPPNQPVALQGNQNNGSNVDANGVPKGRTIGGAGQVPGVGGGIGIGGF